MHVRKIDKTWTCSSLIKKERNIVNNNTRLQSLLDLTKEIFYIRFITIFHKYQLTHTNLRLKTHKWFVLSVSYVNVRLKENNLWKPLSLTLSRLNFKIKFLPWKSLDINSIVMCALNIWTIYYTTKTSQCTLLKKRSSYTAVVIVSDYCTYS